MEIQPSAKAEELSGLMWDFLNERVLPAEAEYDAYRASVGPNDWTLPPVVEELKTEARARGLWNLFLPDVSGLTNVEYAQLAEISGWSVDILPEAINCQAPTPATWRPAPVGTAEQQATSAAARRHSRSGFAMTEPTSPGERHQHRVLHHARRRRVRHQRHQVVDVRPWTRAAASSSSWASPTPTARPLPAVDGPRPIDTPASTSSGR
jgi:hypothetical protein